MWVRDSHKLDAKGLRSKWVSKSVCVCACVCVYVCVHMCVCVWYMSMSMSMHLCAPVCMCITESGVWIEKKWSRRKFLPNVASPWYLKCILSDACFLCFFLHTQVCYNWYFVWKKRKKGNKSSNIMDMELLVLLGLKKLSLCSSLMGMGVVGGSKNKIWQRKRTFSCTMRPNHLCYILQYMFNIIAHSSSSEHYIAILV